MLLSTASTSLLNRGAISLEALYQRQTTKAYEVPEYFLGGMDPSLFLL